MKGVLFVVFCAGLAYVSTFDLVSMLPIIRQLIKVFSYYHFLLSILALLIFVEVTANVKHSSFSPQCTS